MGFGGGVAAMVHPIQAPMPTMETNAMTTGIAISHNLMDSKAGQKNATRYAPNVAMQIMKISTLMA